MFFQSAERVVGHCVVLAQTIDHVASMVAYWLEANQKKSDGADFKPKYWGLSDARKQITDTIFGPSL